jgi:nucleotide-binding universal stress UspA family protein
MPVFQRVLVPVDFSECSFAALREAAQLTRRTGGQIDVLHVWQLPAFVPPESVVGSVGAAGEPLVDLMQTSAETSMRELVGRAHGEGIELGAARVVLGNPGKIIVDEANSGRYDLVALGTHGRGGLSHALMGSVAEKVVRLSPVPVLTVRHTEIS